MSKEEEEKKNKETSKITWDSWLEDLKEKEQPTCNLDDPEDCEACGS
jgi:hypothetical protein